MGALRRIRARTVGKRLCTDNGPKTMPTEALIQEQAPDW